MPTCRSIWPLAVSLAILPGQLQALKPEQKTSSKRERVFDKRHRSYIPMDLDDAMDELDRTINAKDQERIRTSKEESVMYHHGFGTGLRNGWGLWGGSRLAQWFNEKGIFHPDDMSGIILDAWFCRLRGKPFDLEGKVRGYKEYWEKSQDLWKQGEQQAEAARKRIPGLMMGLEIPAAPAEWASLPIRKAMAGPRVRSMSPYREGMVITERKTIWAKGQGKDYSYTAPLFFEPKTRSLSPIRCPEFDRIENAVVIGDLLYLEGIKDRKHLILVIGPKTRTAIPLPSGKGWIRLGIHKDRLIAVFSKSVWEWDGKTWNSMGQPEEELPWCGMPPVVHGDYLYLRDEGQGEDNKSLHWIKLPCQGKLTAFHEDSGLVGPHGPRWEYVWNWTFTPEGSQWITTGDSISPRSLVRREVDGKYGIALIHGETTFSGDLLGGKGGVDRMDFEGICQSKDGALFLAGNKGIYRFEGKRLTPIVGLKRTGQWVFNDGKPTDPDPKDQRGNWHLDPSHVYPVGPHAFLLGSDWWGVYLVERKPEGTWEAICLDEPLSAPITF